jgi:hypothetical protein
MARFHCHGCQSEGTFEYAGVQACPRCGSTNVDLALSILELPDDDSLIRALRKALGCERDYEELPTAWVHGHIRKSADRIIGRTRVIANPKGYPPPDHNPPFDPLFTIDV